MAIITTSYSLLSNHISTYRLFNKGSCLDTVGAPWQASLSVLGRGHIEVEGLLEGHNGRRV